MVVPNRKINVSSDEEYTNQNVTVKILVPAIVAGSIIGKGGEAIKELKSKSNAIVRVSNRDEIFPYTNERIVLIVGPADNVIEAIKWINSKLRSSLTEGKGKKSRVNKHMSNRAKEMKLIVAESSAGKIIGKKGDIVKKIQEDNSVKVVLTTKGEWGVVPGERVATISGKEENINNAAKDIIAVIAKDPHARLDKSLVYPQYPMFDNFMYRGPPEAIYRGPHSPRKIPSAPKGGPGYAMMPRYDGYQSEQPFPRHRGPPPFY